MIRFAKELSVPEGSGRVKIIGGVPVMVLRHKGQLHAYVAICDHKYYVLCERSVRDKIVCPGHGEMFSSETGEPSQGKAKSPLRRLRLEVREGEIWVEVPSREVLEELIKNTSGE
ncbi:MAG: Rieske (2Fe-2S) protein [Acidilobaceae archaeon]|nr:Rieske (2Fe-2S) protein [Acidilobaceae archaeon]MCX8164987.1 Rieske (2Fe-2S) protein [Acidilobaceae archaeon]MDW7974496.1 Rieske (2Fe-2S) protein [Sulfolobales archaeon]